MKKVLFLILFVLISWFIQPVLCAEEEISAINVPRITKEQLKAELGNPDFVIIDVRSDHDWQDSNLKIKGSIREDPHNLDGWFNKYPVNKIIVLYCK
jgi:hypothetical protein